MCTETITICSVNYYSAHYLRLSHYLLHHLASRHTRMKWLIVDNTPDDSERPLLESMTDSELIPSRVRLDLGHDKTDKQFSPFSLQHGAALGELVERINTPYGIIIDPDCFIVRKNWDELLIGALSQRQLVAIGAPYHPCRQFKYGRDFPTVTFLLFDAPRVVPLSLDFSPGPYPPFDEFPYTHSVLKRLKFGTWKDTGWQMRDRFRGRGYRAACFDVPILRPGSERSRAGKFFARFVPERFLQYPRQAYRRPDGGLIDERELTTAPGHDLYEEHYWEGQLILAHLRAVSQRRLPFYSDNAQFWVRRILDHVGLSRDHFLASLGEPSLGAP